MYEYSYNTNDCSGVFDDIDLIVPSNLYYASGDPCDYAVLTSYKEDSDCTGNADTFFVAFIDICRNYTDATETKSEEYSCTENTLTQLEYSTDDCTGTYVETVTTPSDWSTTHDYDFILYCSTVDDESECNEIGGFF